MSAQPDREKRFREIITLDGALRTPATVDLDTVARVGVKLSRSPVFMSTINVLSFSMRPLSAVSVLSSTREC